MFGKKKRWHIIREHGITEMDKKVMYWENKGKLVPTRELIKTPEQIEGIRKSGVINTGVLDEVAKHIHAGMTTVFLMVERLHVLIMRDFPEVYAPA